MIPSFYKSNFQNVIFQNPNNPNLITMVNTSTNNNNGLKNGLQKFLTLAGSKKLSPEHFFIFGIRLEKVQKDTKKTFWRHFFFVGAIKMK